MSAQHTEQEDGGHGSGDHSTNQHTTASDDMGLGSMIKEAEEKGVKGALLSRLKKAKVGKVNLDPSLGMP
jgi:hypothetical protein